MPIPDADIELIDKAIRFELSLEEQELFEEKVGNEDFRNEWNYRRTLAAVVHDHRRDEIKQSLQQVESTLETKKPKSKIWLWIALLLIAFAAWYFTRAETPEEIYMAYYEPFPNDIDPLHKGVQTQSVYHLYELEEYEKVVTALAPPFASEEAEWFYIQASMGLERDQEAMDLLQELVQKPNHRYTSPANYYLALLHIKGGSQNEAIPLLERLVEKGKRPYSAKAQALLNRLAH